MHDIGPTQLETEAFAGQPYEQAYEMDGHREQAEFGEAAGPLTEAQELELAAELLEVTGEEELEQFLGDLFQTVGRAAGRFVRSDTGRALGGILKDAAKQALPIVGRGVGQWISPGQGGDIGARAGAAAGTLLGLELEGLSHEDREWEAARQFVRFATAAAQRACQAPAGMPPAMAARSAAASAARVHAPGLLTRLRGRSGTHWPRSGRWFRRGRTIVLHAG